MKNFFRQLIDALLQVLELFGNLMRQIVGAPIKSLVEVFSRKEAKWEKTWRPDSKEREQKPFLMRILNAIVDTIRFVVWCFLQVLAFPFRFLRHLFTNARADLLWCIPAFVVIVLMVFVIVRVVSQKGTIQRQYRVGVTKAMESRDFELAKTYSQRLVSWPGETFDSDRLNWALCLMETGESELGMQILDELAPNDATGYPPAHRMKVMVFSQQLQQTRRRELLEPLRHHLDNADGQDSEQILAAHVLYFIQTGQPDRAISFLEILGEKMPKYFVQLAAIYNEFKMDEELAPEERIALETSRLDAMRKAEQGFRRLLERDQLQHPVRIALATVLTKLDRNAEAEELLQQGLRLKSDAAIRRALADYYILLHDQSANFDEQLALIQKSLNYDINYVVAYQRILLQFQARLKDDPEKAKEIEDLLMSSIASGESTALAHFAMSNLRSLQGDQQDAMWHLEKAYALDSRFGAIANNLAWRLAHDEENPNLDRAYELAVDLLERYPNEPRMRDTYATVLLKQGLELTGDEATAKYEEALTQFEQVLGKIENKKPVHEKLATIYEKLGKSKMADIHRKKAAELEQAAKMP